MKRSRNWLALISITALLLVTLLGGIVTALAGNGNMQGGGDQQAVTESGNPGSESVAVSSSASEGQELPAGSGGMAEGENKADAEENTGSGAQVLCPPPLGNGKICVVKFEDLDGDGKFDDNESGMPGVTITLNEGNSRQTDGQGKVCYTDLTPGTYKVSEIVPEGYRATTETSHTIELCSYHHLNCFDRPSCGETITVFFGNAPLKTPKGSISGHKYEDLDGDGEYDAGEPAVPGVTVELWKDGEKAAETVTGEDGSYRFDDLEDGTYMVKEILPAGWYTTSPDDCSYQGIQVVEGQEVTGLDFLNARLKGSISGHKWLDPNGDGYFGDRTPYSGSSIELWKNGENISQATTGADGSYSFLGLEAGNYTVKEIVPDNLEALSPESVEVELEPGENATEIDFYNRGKICSDGIIEARVRVDINCNGEFDDSDTPLDGVTVELFHIEKDGSLTPVNPPSQLTGPGWGWWVFFFKIPVYYPGGHVIWENLPRAYAGEQFAWYRLRLVVPDGYEVIGPSEYDLPLRNCPLPCFWYCKDFLLQNRFHISGHKYEDLDGDGEYDAGEPAVPGVTVELWKDGEKAAETVTGEDGSYRFDDLEDGVYTVKEIPAPGWYPTSPADGTYEGIEVGCGDNVEGLDFLNRRFLSVSGHKWEDLDQDGTHDPGEPAVPGVTVELWKDGEKAAETVTGEDGSYLFEGLLPGNYTVSEVLPAGWFPTNPLDGSHDNFNLVYGQPMENLDFHNCRYGTIKGVKFLDSDLDGVMDEGEEGLDGVTIKLNGGLYSIITAGGGRFSFENLNPGTYVVTVDETSNPGHYPTGPTSIQVELEPGETETVYFGNAPYGSISGHKWLDSDYDGVWDAGETTVIPGITIKLYSGNPPGELVGIALTDEDGTYSFNDLIPGVYTVVEQGRQGYFSTSPDSVVVELSAGEGAVVDFGNCPYGRIQGLKFQDLDGDGVRDAGEEGFRGVKIILEGMGDPGGFAETVTGEDGYFVFENLLPGDYAVSETVPPGFYATQPIRMEVSVGPGESLSVIFANAPYGSIAGAKWLDDGDNTLDPTKDSPGPGITIKLTGKTLDGEEVSMQTTTGTDGTFSFLLLEAGNYTVSEEFDLTKYAAITDESIDVEVAPGEEKNVDFLNGVIIIGGEVVEPPVTPTTPPAITGGTTTLPTTGMEQLPLLLAAAALVLLGLALLSVGLRRRQE